MKSVPDITRALEKASGQLSEAGFVKAAAFAIVACALAIAQSSPQIHPSQTALPEVHLDADGLTPRPIEQLTGTTIARHYALAWRDLAGALESSRTEGLSEEFIGFAKDRFMQRIGEQKQTGVHVRIVDHGHRLKAVFYSTDGTAMQLLDEAQLEIQTFDGNKLIDTQSAPREYMVLMTPGADRWYIRDLEEVPAKSF
jgi:hypothetical protein